jgi:hypothetical protein
MIEIGTLVQWKDGNMGIVIETHRTDGCNRHAYKIDWFDGSLGFFYSWQFEVIG